MEYRSVFPIVALVYPYYSRISHANCPTGNRKKFASITLAYSQKYVLGVRRGSVLRKYRYMTQVMPFMETTVMSHHMAQRAHQPTFSSRPKIS